MRNRIITAIFCAASILSLWAVAAFKPTSPYTIDTPYEYPYVPGTQEWYDFEDVFAMREATQVPDEILQQMTTEALLQTVLDHPLLPEIICFESLKIGYQEVKSRYNCLQEFVTRPNCLEVLSRYRESISSSGEEKRPLERLVVEALYSSISAELEA